MSCGRCGGQVKSPYAIYWPCREATRVELTGREAGKALLTGMCLECGRPVNPKYLKCFACARTS